MSDNVLLHTEDLLASSSRLLVFATAEDWVNFGELLPHYMLNLEAFCNACFSLSTPDAQAQIKPAMLRLQAQHDAIISHTRRRRDELSQAIAFLQKSHDTARAYNAF